MRIAVESDLAGPRPPSEWRLRPVCSARAIAALVAVALLLALSAHRTEMDRMVTMTAEAVGVMLGLRESSQVTRGLGRVASDLFPMQVSESTAVARIENFDPERLPWFSRIETESRTEQRMNRETLQMESVTTEREVLYRPFGYLQRVIALMLETIEIALWGTILAVLIAIPLGICGAANYAPFRALYAASRMLSSLLRAVPELISALFLVLAFGFGPIAGVLALGLHTAGFLGKFFADDIENADRGPQDALRSTGANRIKVLAYAVLPQVLPQYLAYMQYILERNIRTATIIGIVGAGGIGQELKGRFEMFNYGHVCTILVVIFITVVALEHLTARVRSRLI